MNNSVTVAIPGHLLKLQSTFSEQLFGILVDLKNKHAKVKRELCVLVACKKAKVCFSIFFFLPNLPPYLRWLKELGSGSWAEGPRPVNEDLCPSGQMVSSVSPIPLSALIRPEQLTGCFWAGSLYAQSGWHNRTLAAANGLWHHK